MGERDNGKAKGTQRGLVLPWRQHTTFDLPVLAMTLKQQAVIDFFFGYIKLPIVLVWRGAEK